MQISIGSQESTCHRQQFAEIWIHFIEADANHRFEGITIMNAKQAAAAVQPKPDLSQQYRPLGLKAVLAAAMMLKAPKKKIA
jgi:hypothetical protein